MKAARSNRRRGTSLVEMLVFTGLTSMTLTMMSMLTHTILKVSRRMTTQSQVRQVHARLQQQLSLDAMDAQASKVMAAENESAWRFVYADGRQANFRASGAMIQRELLDPAEKVTHRDQFALPRPYQFVVSRQAAIPTVLEIQVVEEGAADASGRSAKLQTGLRLAVVTEAPAEVAP